MKILILTGLFVLGIAEGNTSCQGRCGGPDVIGCFCHALCGGFFTVGCCPDYQKYCGDGYEPISTPKPVNYNILPSYPPETSCMNPGTIKNGYHSGGLQQYFTIGDKVWYACRRGYILSGPIERKCTSANIKSLAALPSWSPTEIPLCRKPFHSSCRQIIEPYDGGFIGFKEEYSEGDVVNFFCNEGYSILGKSKITCDGSIWNGVEPNCMKTDPCLEVQCRNHSICEDGKCVCKEGYNGGGCEPFDICELIDCLDGSECKIVDGKAKCRCGVGYELGTDNKCIK